jgi:transposase
MEIVMSVLGVGVCSGVVILVELGEVERFSSGKAVASWCGLVSSLHQSVGVTILGHMTKRGSRYLRWCMVEVVHGVLRSDCRFRALFNRIVAKKGKKVVFVVARKMLAVVWHLLCNNVKYVDDGFSKRAVWVRCVVVEFLSFEIMVETLRNVGFVVSKRVE